MSRPKGVGSWARLQMKWDNWQAKHDHAPVPHEDWVLNGWKDLQDKPGTCQMCGQRYIRYAHLLTHPRHDGVMLAGSNCVEMMVADTAQFERDRLAMQAAAGRARAEAQRAAARARAEEQAEARARAYEKAMAEAQALARAEEQAQARRLGVTEAQRQAYRDARAARREAFDERVALRLHELRRGGLLPQARK